MSHPNVFVALWEGREGPTVQVFATESAAKAWRKQIADDNWSDDINGEIPRPMDDELMADEYWEFMSEVNYRGQFFTIFEEPIQ